MLSVIRALSLGESLFGCFQMAVPTRARVLVVEQEIGEYGLQKRAKNVFRGDAERLGDYLWYKSKDKDLNLSTFSGRERLISYVEGIKPNVLVLDPIGRMHSYEENSNTEIGKLLDFLDSVVDTFSDLDLSIVFSHHFGKPPHDKSDYDPLSPRNFRGSSRWGGNPDTLLTVERKEKILKPWDAWKIHMRMETRQGSSLPDMILHVNEEEKGQPVIWKRWLNGAPPEPLEQTPPQPADRAYQAS